MAAPVAFGVARLALPAVLRVLLQRPARRRRLPARSLRADVTCAALRAVSFGSLTRGVAWLREAQEALAAPSPALAQVSRERVEADGVRCEWFAPRNGGARHTIVYLHGGGFVIGSVNAYGDFLARLALGANARVLGVDYRLAPEHPFPAAQDDALAATRFALRQAPARATALAGDSAGGSLAVATLCALRDAGEALPAAAVLFSPWTQPFATTGSMERHAQDDFGDASLLVPWAKLAIGAGDPEDPRFCVARARLAGLPPLQIQLGGAEVLLDQVRDFAARAREAGVSVELREYPDQFHVFQVAAPGLPEGTAARADAFAFLHRLLGG